MSVLIALPEDLFIEILQEWLQTEQIGLLDTACCNKVLRCQFLKQLKVIAVSSAVFRLHFFYDWVDFREIKLNNLVLNDRCFDGSNTKFKVRCENVQVIRLTCFRCASVASNFINSCPNLTSLRFDCCVDIVSIVESINNLGKIEHLRLDEDSNIEITFKIFAQRCTQLRSFVHQSGFVDSRYEPLYKQIFLNNQKLNKIQTVAVLSLSMIRECCPNIEILRVSIDAMDVPELIALLEVVKLFDCWEFDSNTQIIYDKEKNFLRLLNEGKSTCDSMKQLVKGMKGLKIIELNNIKLSEEAVDHLSSSLEQIIWHNDNQLDTLQLLLTKCKQLRTVHLTASRYFVAPELITLFSSVKPMKLQELKIACASISVSDKITIMRFCKGLQRLIVTFSIPVFQEAIDSYKTKLQKFERPTDIRVDGIIPYKVTIVITISPTY